MKKISPLTVAAIIVISLAAAAVLLLWGYSFTYISHQEVYTEDDYYSAERYDNVVEITEREGRFGSVIGKGLVRGQTVYITSGGSYRISGAFKNIVIESSDITPVAIELNGAIIQSEQQPPVYVYRASKLILSSRIGSENYISDNRVQETNGKKGSAVYSPSDITFNGAGTIHINGKLKHAVKSGGAVKLMSGVLDVSASGDGVSADGNVYMEQIDFRASVGDDAVHSDSGIYVNSGKVLISKCYEGLEGKYIEINGGDIHITSADDGINVSGDDSRMPKAPDNIPMSKDRGAPPGIDGQNKPGGPPPDMDGQDKPGGPPPDMDGQNKPGGPPPEPPKMNIADDENVVMDFVMNGGSIYIESNGDGIDINGSCEMNGGSIIAFAKTDGPENAFDFDGILRVNGGSFVGAGNPNMVASPSDKSKRCSLLVTTGQTYRSGGEISIVDSSGKTVENIKTDGSFGWIGVYGDKILLGETYRVFVDGKEIISAEINSKVTAAVCKRENIGQAPMMPPMGNLPPGQSEKEAGIGGPPPNKQNNIQKNK